MIKVLFIGADPQTAEVANHIRSRWPDAKSLVADSGADGIGLLEQTSPDMVLLYSSLPDMALAKAIWGLRRISNVLLLVLGHPESEREIVSALQIGADAFVKLPCDTAEVMARISSLLRRAGSPVRQEKGNPILTSITTSVQGGMWGDARMAARRLAWERLARSLLSCVSSSHRSNSVGPNRSRGSISRTTR